MNESLENLQRLCGEWQERLRLQHWDVEVEVVGLKDVTDVENAAEILMNREPRKAKIRYVPIDDRPESWLPLPDTEELIVHELLHLHFFGFNTKTGSPEELAEEQTTHLLANLLVQLKYVAADDVMFPGVIRETLDFKSTGNVDGDVQLIKNAGEALAELYKLRFLQKGTKIEVEVRVHPRVAGTGGDPCTDVS